MYSYMLLQHNADPRGRKTTFFKIRQNLNTEWRLIIERHDCYFEVSFLDGALWCVSQNI